MKKNKNDLTAEAKLGYLNSEGPCSFYATSPSSNAWHVGQWLKTTGRTASHDVRPSRGDTMHVNGMKVRLHFKGYEITNIERIS